MGQVYPNPYYAPYGTGGQSSAVPSFPAELDVGNKTGAASADLSSILNQKMTLTGNTTLTLSGLLAGKSQWFQFKVVQGGAGSFTLAIAGAKVPGGALNLSSAPSSVDLVSGYWDGVNIYASVAGLAFA